MDEREAAKGRGADLAERLVGAALIVVSLFLMATIYDLPSKPRAFPFVLLVLLVGLGLYVAVRPSSPDEPARFRGLVNVGGAIVLVGAYLAGIGIIGFLTATILFVALALILSGFLRRHRFRYPLIVAVAVPLALFMSLVLVDLLKLPMP
jgi:hypothetical protein